MELRQSAADMAHRRPRALQRPPGDAAAVHGRAGQRDRRQRRPVGVEDRLGDDLRREGSGHQDARDRRPRCQGDGQAGRDPPGGRGDDGQDHGRPPGGTDLVPRRGRRRQVERLDRRQPERRRRRAELPPRNVVGRAHGGGSGRQAAKAGVHEGRCGEVVAPGQHLAGHLAGPALHRALGGVAVVADGGQLEGDPRRLRPGQTGGVDGRHVRRADLLDPSRGARPRGRKMLERQPDTAGFGTGHASAPPRPVICEPMAP